MLKIADTVREKKDGRMGQGKFKFSAGGGERD